MRITITPSQMKQLEADFMNEYHLPGALLMEHAAQGVVTALRELVSCGRVLFLCGPGNNGGDGYAAARLWQQAGGTSVIWQLIADASGDAGMNLALAKQAGIPICQPEEDAPLPPCDAVCDALFGTGLNRAPEGPAAAWIRRVNASGLPIVAVDIPSGMNGLTGKPMGPTIRAAVTVTFHRPKQGLVIADSAGYTGRLIVHPILIPQAYGCQEGLRCLQPQELPSLLPARDPNAHKGTYGRTVLFVGSTGMAGAAALCAKAALKVGSGLTTLLVRASILPIVQMLVPGATCIVLPEENGFLTPAAGAFAAETLRGATAAAVGCGLSQSEDAIPVLKAFHEADCPVVWDADALNLLSTHPQLLPLPDKDFITPHPGEAARLLHCSTAQILADPLTALAQLHRIAGCQVLLKGARTLMTDGSAIAANLYGSPAMAKGGSGDILTGVLAGLLAQQLLPDDLTTLQCAALLHGLAGKRAAEQYGEYSVTPEAMVDCIRIP